MNIQHSQIKSSLYDLTEKVYIEKIWSYCTEPAMYQHPLTYLIVIASLNEIKAK